MPSSPSDQAAWAFTIGSSSFSSTVMRAFFACSVRTLPRSSVARRRTSGK